MESFYKKLIEGQSKSNALKNTQQEFLNHPINNNDLIDKILTHQTNIYKLLIDNFNKLEPLSTDMDTPIRCFLISQIY